MLKARKYSKLLIIVILAALLLMPGIISAATNGPEDLDALSVSVSLVAPATTQAGQAITVQVNVTADTGSCFDTVGIYLDVDPNAAITSYTVSAGYNIVSGSQESTATSYGATLTAPGQIDSATETVMEFTITSNTAGSLTGITVDGTGVNKSAAWCGGAYADLKGATFNTTVQANTVSGKIVNDAVKPYGQEDVGDTGLAGATINILQQGTSTVVGTGTSIGDGTYTVSVDDIGTYDYEVLFPASTPPYLPTTGPTGHMGTVAVVSGGVTGLNVFARNQTQTTGTLGDLTPQLDSVGETATLSFEPVVGSTETTVINITADPFVVELDNAVTADLRIRQPGRATVFGQTQYAGTDPSQDYEFGSITPCVSTDPEARSDTLLADTVGINAAYNTANDTYNPVATTYSPNVDGADISAAINNFWSNCTGSHPDPNAIIGGLRTSNTDVEYGPDNPAATVRYDVRAPQSLQGVGAANEAEYNYIQLGSLSEPRGITSSDVVDITVSIYAKSAVPVGAIAVRMIMDIPNSEEGIVHVVTHEPAGMKTLWNEAAREIAIRIGTKFDVVMVDDSSDGLQLRPLSDDQPILTLHYAGTVCPSFMVVSEENVGTSAAVTTVANQTKDLYTAVTSVWTNCVEAEPRSPWRLFLSSITRAR